MGRVLRCGLQKHKNQKWLYNVQFCFISAIIYALVYIVRPYMSLSLPHAGKGACPVSSSGQTKRTLHIGTSGDALRDIKGMIS